MFLAKFFQKSQLEYVFIHRGLTTYNNYLYRKPNWLRNSAYVYYHQVDRRHMCTMKAWQADELGLSNLKFSSTEIPSINKPNEVLVKVTASSVNPLDILMLDGYGSRFYKYLRVFSMIESADMLPRPNFPLTGGRDFVGVVVRIGHSVKDVKVYDKVWGVVMPHNQGCHAEYVVTSDSLVCHKPENVSDVEAACLPYIGLTGWSTVVFSGGLDSYSCNGLNIAIIGASGGVGTFLTQLLSFWGAKVSAVCNKDSFDLVKSCGASEVYDSSDPETIQKLSSEPKFHMVIDAASGKLGKSWVNAIEPTKYSAVITLKNPLLVNIDKNGLIEGTRKSLVELIRVNSDHIPPGIKIKWSFFFPSKEALQYIGKLVTEGKIRPIVDKVFVKDDLLLAYDHVQNGRKRGKTVIDFNK